MDNIYYFEKGQWRLYKRNLIFFIMAQMNWIIYPLATIIGVLIYGLGFDFEPQEIFTAILVVGVVVAVLSLAFVSSVSALLGLRIVLREILQKRYTVQMKPGGIIFGNGQGKYRLIPAENIKRVTLVNKIELVKDIKEEDVAVWLMVYNIELYTEQGNKEIRFTEYIKDGRTFSRNIFGFESTNKFTKQIKSLDRSNEFMDYIYSEKDRNSFEINCLNKTDK